MAIKLDADAGFVDVSIGEVTVRLDLFEANGRYASLCDQITETPDLADAYADWLVSKGLPRPSQANAFKLADEIARQAELLKKTLGFTSPSAGSSVSTGSTASAATSPPDPPAT